MRCNIDFKRQVFLKCLDALEAEGFARHRKEAVDWPIHDGFHAWVGLTVALGPNRLKILPCVGVHVVPIAKLCASKRGRYRVRYNRGVATYATELKGLDAAARERAFVFDPEQSEAFIVSECQRLARLVATVGLDYARSIASYEALLPLLRERVKTLGGYPESFASCLYRMGRKEGARQFVEGFLEEWRDYFEGFAIPFLKRLSRDGVPGGAQRRAPGGALASR